MTPIFGFIFFLIITLILLGFTVWSGLRAIRKVHICCVVSAVLSLGVTIYFAEQLGRQLDLDRAGWIKPVHLVIAKLATAAYLAPIVTGVRLLSDPRRIGTHRIAAYGTLGLTILTAITGCWMVIASL